LFGGIHEVEEIPKMLLTVDGQRPNSVGRADYWGRFLTLQRHPDLFSRLRDQATAGVDAAVSDQREPAIDSARLGAQVLSTIGSWWHGEFSRRFPNFPNGAAAGLFGMLLWNYLAERPDDYWGFVEQEDPHRQDYNHMFYWRLRPDDPRVIADTRRIGQVTD
jgi:hypothetical protein